jgi:hypothetical protein
LPVKQKGKSKPIPPANEEEPELSDTAEIDTDISGSDLTSDDEELPLPLVCVVWVAKAGQRKPVGSYLLETVDLLSMTYPQFVARFDKAVSTKCGAKDTTNTTISYRAKPCKAAAKSTDFPKGFPNCVDFAEFDSTDAYESFRELVRMNLTQMKKGTKPVIQLVATIAQNPVAAGEDQGVVTTGNAGSDGDIIGSPGRQVFPFRLRADSDRHKEPTRRNAWLY